MLYRFRADHLAPLVAAGVKRATLRAGPRAPRVGERLTMMLGALRLLEPDATCQRVTPIAVRAEAGPWQVARGGRPLDAAEAEALARRLGHRDGAAAAAYYRAQHGPAFDGHLVEW